MMLLIGCDYHPSVQQIAMVNTETGDYSEHRLKHSDGEAEKFYRDLKVHTPEIRVGFGGSGMPRRALSVPRTLPELTAALKSFESYGVEVKDFVLCAGYRDIVVIFQVDNLASFARAIIDSRQRGIFKFRELPRCLQESGILSSYRVPAAKRC